jgi:hypothetical protein
MNKIDKLILNIYREVYKNSTPPANFDELLEKAELNEFRQKDIHFRNYTISESLYQNIVENEISKFKLNKWQIDVVKRSLLLGAIPVFEKA